MDSFRLSGVVGKKLRMSGTPFGGLFVGDLLPLVLDPDFVVDLCHRIWSFDFDERTATCGLVARKPVVFRTGSAIHGPPDDAEVRRSLVTRTVTLPHMLLVEADFVVEIVEYCDIAACCLIDAEHVGMKVLPVVTRDCRPGGSQRGWHESSRGSGFPPDHCADGASVAAVTV